MIEAQEDLATEIENLIFKDNNIQIISNYDAQINNDKLVKKNLQKQMANKVKWTQSINKLEEVGEKKIIEIGPNKAKWFNKGIQTTLYCFN